MHKTHRGRSLEALPKQMNQIERSGKRDRRPRHLQPRSKARCAGFTLIELLVTLAILALLATLATPPVLNYLASAKTDTAKIQIDNLGAALDLYRLDVGRYPTQEEGITALIERPQSAESWNGPYVKKAESLTDPWGEPYIYVIPGDHGDYDLYSLGADQVEGGEGGESGCGKLVVTTAMGLRWLNSL